MHPKSYFDANPYSSNKVPARRGSGGLPTKKDDVKPFKPSSPGKKVKITDKLGVEMEEKC